MWWYGILIGLIILDFSIEYLLKQKGLLDNAEKHTKLNRFLNFIFKYRVLTIISMVLFSTFRSLSVGADNNVYLKYYNNLKNNKNELFKSPLTNYFEFGYTFLNSILVLLNANFRVLFFIISIFVSISLVLFVNKTSPNKCMSILLYVMLGTFAQSLGSLRQIIAMAFVLFAIISLVDKKWIRSIIFILLGTTFHVSAIVCLIIIPLRFIKPKLWIVCSVFAVTVIGSFVFPYALQLLEKFTFLDYYTKYYIQLADLRGASNLLNTLYSIVLLVLFVGMYWARFKFLQLDEKNKAIYDFFLLIFMFVAVFRVAGFILEMPELFNRLNMYFFISLIILIPLFVKGITFNINLYKIANISVYIIATCYMLYLYAIKNTCGVYPFVFM